MSPPDHPVKENGAWNCGRDGIKRSCDQRPAQLACDGDVAPPVDFGEIQTPAGVDLRDSRAHDVRALRFGQQVVSDEDQVALTQLPVEQIIVNASNRRHSPCQSTTMSATRWTGTDTPTRSDTSEGNEHGD